VTRRNNLKILVLLVEFLTIVSACTGSQSSGPSSAVIADPTPTPRGASVELQHASAEAVRRIDFSNFRFPWLRELGDPKQSINLRNGELKPTFDQKGMVATTGVTLRSVAYGDVTGDGREEAFVVLSIVTGGSAIPHAVYIYTSKDGSATLLWAFATGDRADGGLRRVYAENGELVVERYSPVKSKGDCCPTLFARLRYEWQRTHFQQRGKEEILPNSENTGAPL
jgi:hypothetical protein